MTRPRTPAAASDGLLYGLGLLGFILFFVLLRYQHPYAAADFSLGLEGARKAAQDFLRANGYDAAGLEVAVTYGHDARLMDSLQAALRRPGAVELLQEDEEARLPAYYYEVVWNRSGLGEDEEREQVYRVLVSTAGEPFHFEREAGLRTRVSRNALASVLRAPQAGEATPTLPETATDSLLRALLAFSDVDSTWRAARNDTAESADVAAVGSELAKGRGATALKLGPEWAVAIARHHLRQSALSGYDFRVDSVAVVERDNARHARVGFVADLLDGRPAVRSSVEVTPTGALLEMRTSFFAPADEPEVEEVVGNGVQVTFGGVADGVAFATYILLTLTFLFLFLRRLHARAVDSKMALRDALWGGVFAGTVVALTVIRSFFEEETNIWFAVFISMMTFLISASGGAMLIFILSNASESIARGLWPEKLEAFTHVRLGFIRSVPVGHGFLRGLALGGLLLGVVAGCLALLPGARIDFSGGSEYFVYQDVPSAVALLLTMYGFLSQLLCFLILAGVGTLLYQWRKQAPVVIGGLALTFVLVQFTIVDVAPVHYEFLFAGAVGTTLALAFWRYDLLTCFIGNLTAGLFWGLAPAIVMQGSPLVLDLWIAVGLVVLCVVIGVVGVVSKKSGEEVPSYVPSYVQEMAQEERLKGELEIAHLVQESFLPRRMPRVPGLDVAGMCLPAQEVGGDYFDFVELGPGRLGVVVGDVSGKGIQAAFYMTLVKGFFLTLCRVVESPAEVLRRLNTLFCENAPKGLFISLIYGIIDVETRTFTFARAGHNPVIVKRSPSQDAEMVQPRGLAIGLVTGSRFDGTIEETTIHLRTGDVLVLYTDGFSEAMNAARQQYGDARLARKVSIVGQRSAPDILRTVSEDVHHFLEAVGRHDDMTMVVVKVEPRAAQVVAPPAKAEPLAVLEPAGPVAPAASAPLH